MRRLTRQPRTVAMSRLLAIWLLGLSLPPLYADLLRTLRRRAQAIEQSS